MKIFIGLIFVVWAIFTLSTWRDSRSLASAQTGNAARTFQPNTLCAKDERVIFGCLLKRPAKIVSLCAAKDLTSESGYLQYRFGLPARIELEFPKDRQGTQQKFEYTHYFRARFELNEINFTTDGVNYSVFDDYNGEEKPEVMLQGVSINQRTQKKEVRYLCRTKPKADYTDLEAALSSH